MVSRSRGQRRITGHQRCSKRLGERNIGGIIHRDIVAQFPDPEQKEVMWVSGQWKIDKIFQRMKSTGGIKFLGPLVPAQDLRDLDIEQMGCVKGFAGIE